MIRILVSASNAERLTAAREFIRSFPPAAERLLIGGSREAVDHLVREVSISEHATFGLHRFSLTQLAARLATTEFARRGLVHSTSLGAEAVAARASFEVLERAGLGYFQPVARRPGFARALASTVNELRLAGVEPASLADFEEAGPDLAELLGAVENQLRTASVADRAVLFRTAAKTAMQAEGEPYRLLPILMLDVPIGSPAEHVFVRALVTSAPSVLATVPLGDDVTLAGLETLPGAERITLVAPQPDSTLRRLVTYVFSEAQPPQREAGNEVCFFSAPGEGRECVEIARRILEEARRGIRFDQMAILLRAPAAYSGLLESALNRAGIPSFFGRGTRRPDPAGRAFLALLACGVEHLSARRFAEYLSLGQVPALDATGAPPLSLVARGDSRSDDESLGPAADPALTTDAPSAPEPRDWLGEATWAPGAGAPDVGPSGARPPSARDPDETPVVDGSLRVPWKWEELLVEAKVIGGQDRWARRLQGLEGELTLKLETLRAEEPDASRVLAVERDLRNLGHLRRFALPVVEALAGFPARAHWGTWLELLQQFAPRVLRRPQRVLSVLAELKPMGAVGPVSLDEVRGVLAQRLSTLEREPPRRPYGQVFVATPEQARGRSFEVVFVPGVAERIFPQAPREDPILLDVLRRQLASKGDGKDRPEVRLRMQDDRVQAERLLLRLAVGAARGRLYLSYPRIEVSLSRPRVASFYALDVQRAVTGSIPDIEKLERAAERESDARLAWPAPRDACRAIDNLEHDLAVLGTYLHQAPLPKLKGRARYLLELNPHLARSLRTRWARWHQRKWSRADGLCEPTEATDAALRVHRLRARPYSVSALQKFATCPYQFLLSAIHRLEPREEIAPLEQMDPLTRGHMFHRVQAEFMRRLQRSGELPVSPGSLETALLALDETLDEVARQYREDLAPAIERVWQDAVETLRTDLRAWLHNLVETSGDHPLWHPIHFEFGFGFPPGAGRDPASIAEPVDLPDGYKLHGIVDLIEQHTEVGTQGFAPLRVTDHKTGTNRTKENLIIGGGEVLQPVLYGMAVEASLGKPVSQARLYFCTPEGGFTERSVPMNGSNRQRGLDVLATIDRAIETTFLPPAPRQKACVWCDFRDVCGPYEERRFQQKDLVPLKDLLTLRAQP